MYSNTNLMALVYQVEQTKEDRPWIYDDDDTPKIQPEKTIVNRHPKRKIGLRHALAVVLNTIKK